MKGFEKDEPADKKLSHQGWSAIIQGFQSCSRHTTSRSNKFTCGPSPQSSFVFPKTWLAELSPISKHNVNIWLRVLLKVGGKAVLGNMLHWYTWQHAWQASQHLVPKCRGLLTNGSAQRQRSPNSTAQTGRCPAWRSGSSIHGKSHRGNHLQHSRPFTVTVVASTSVHANGWGLDAGMGQTLTLDGCSSGMGMTYFLMHVTQQFWPGTPCMMACPVIAFSLNVQKLQVMLHVRNW